MISIETSFVQHISTMDYSDTYFTDNMSHSYEDNLFDYETHYIGEVDKQWYVFQLLALILIVLGLVCNVLCIAVFVTKEMRSKPIYFHFLLLSVVDVCILLGSKLIVWLQWTYHLNMMRLSLSPCLTFYVFVHTLYDAGNILIAIISFGHCNTKCFKCSQSSQRYPGYWHCQPCFVVWLIIIILILILFSVFVSHQVYVYNEYLMCYHHTSFLEIIKPSIAIVIFSVLSIIYLYRCLRRRRTPTPNEHSDSSHDNLEIAAVNVTLQLNKTLFILLFSYVLTHAPIIVMIILYLWRIQYYNVIISDAFVIPYWSYFSLKFFIYLSTLPDFRFRLKAIFKRRIQRTPSHEAFILS